jgi:hypothetical protein
MCPRTPTSYFTHGTLAVLLDAMHRKLEALRMLIAVAGPVTGEKLTSNGASQYVFEEAIEGLPEWRQVSDEDTDRDFYHGPDGESDGFVVDFFLALDALEVPEFEAGDGCAAKQGQIGGVDDNVVVGLTPAT